MQLDDEIAIVIENNQELIIHRITDDVAFDLFGVTADFEHHGVQRDFRIRDVRTDRYDHVADNERAKCSIESDVIENAGVTIRRNHHTMVGRIDIAQREAAT